MPTLRLRSLIAALTAAASLLCAAPALAGEAAVGVEAGPTPDLVRFDTAAPGALVARVPVAGLLAGEGIAGLDAQPGSGEIWALTTFNRVFEIDVETGDTEQLGSLAAASDPTGGLDHDPVNRLLRWVNASDENIRFDPVTLQGSPQLPVTYGSAVDPAIVGIAYTNNDVSSGTPSTLVGIDAASDTLVRVGGENGTPSPDDGLMTTIGPLGQAISDGAFDIAGPSNAAFAALRGPTGPSTLYSVNLTTGAASGAGIIGGAPLAGMTIMPGGAARASTPSTAASEAAASARVTIQRSGNSLLPVSIAYRTADRTASAGQDYAAVSGTLEFAQGERSKQITIPLRQDTTLEAPEAFSLLLGPTAGGVALDTREHTIGLVDDERSTIQITSAPDRIRPAFLMAPAPPDHLRALSRARRLRLDFACSERCVVELTLKLGRKRLGGGLAALERPGVKRATVRLTKAGRRAVVRASKARKRGRVLLKLTGVATDSAGNRARRTATLRLARR